MDELLPLLPEVLRIPYHSAGLTHDEELALACLDRAIDTHQPPNEYHSDVIRVERIQATALKYLQWVKEHVPDA